MAELPDRAWETVSAMQKCVRRGQEEQAGRFFFEMAEAGHFAWAIKRLHVIAYEDVGLGDPAAVMFAETSLTQASAWKKGNNGPWRLAAANAILALCRAKKTRLADHFLAVCLGRNIETLLEIPDYALDIHTRKGQAMGRGYNHFRQEGALLTNKANIPDPYEDEAYKIWASGILKKYEVTKEVKETEAVKEEKVVPTKRQVGLKNFE